MPKPHGFHYEANTNGTVKITHNGRAATTLRGPRADQFLKELVMARWTGNYKHGNERTARNHPRNSR
jgi:hypothetical protein